jgi:succinate dehydrogenase / fumarate reductase, cytochrome b subunit
LRDVREALMVARNSDGQLVHRPLSPHVQVYRWPLSMALSILHRITGVGLGIGTLLLTCWLTTAATTQEGFDRFQSFLGSAVGLFLLFCWSLSLIYHFMSGLRHLFMDLGNGFDEKHYEKTGMAVVISTGVVTIGLWVIGLIVW